MLFFSVHFCVNSLKGDTTAKAISFIVIDAYQIYALICERFQLFLRAN